MPLDILCPCTSPPFSTLAAAPQASADRFAPTMPPPGAAIGASLWCASMPLMQLTADPPNLFAPRRETPYPTARATQEMVAQAGWLPWEDHAIRVLTEPERRAGGKMSWVRVCEHLPHRSAQGAARAREGCGSTSKAAPSRSRRARPYDLGTAAAGRSARHGGAGTQARGRVRAKGHGRPRPLCALEGSIARGAPRRARRARALRPARAQRTGRSGRVQRRRVVCVVAW